MRKVLIILSIFTLCSSCNSSLFKWTKNKDTKTDRQIKEKEVINSTRPGDTLKYTILNPIFKDTTLYIKNKQKVGSNSLIIDYDRSGRQTIQCISDEIKELKETIRSIRELENEKLKVSSKEKESMLKPSFIVYIFLGLAFLIFVSKLSNKLI